MTIASPSWRRALVLFAAVVGTLIVANPAQAQEDLTGARANKDCPGTTATPGQTIICNFEVENTGDLPATVTTLREISPFPGGALVNITCTGRWNGHHRGQHPGPGRPCTGTFQVTIPNDPALCGTVVADRVEIALRYTDVLVADAGATGITFIVCPADITITKTADALSKVGDSVTYTFRDLQHRRRRGEPCHRHRHAARRSSRRRSRPPWRRASVSTLCDACGASR